MKAWGTSSNTDLRTANPFHECELPDPEPGSHDLLVRPLAYGLNPIDTKVRQRRAANDQSFQILGWDACAEVLAAGAEVHGFHPGEQVYYAGDHTRPGCQAELHLIDHRLAARAPANLEPAESAVVPLVAITAWEALIEKFGLSLGASSGSQQRLLILGGAGGVGSMALQLARLIPKLQILATASSPEGAEWCRQQGAHVVLDHSEPNWHQELPAGSIHYLLDCAEPTQHWAALAHLLAPQGQLCLLVDAKQPVDLNPLKSKSISLHWEFMFTRPLHQTPDQQAHHHILQNVAHLLEAKQLTSPLRHTLGPISPTALHQGHLQLETQHTIGKLALTNR